MKVRICGKRVMKGIGKKTGNPYDFTEIHYLGKDPRVEGNVCRSTTIPATVLPAAQIVVGADYDIEYNEEGYLVSFAPCK